MKSVIGKFARNELDASGILLSIYPSVSLKSADFSLPVTYYQRGLVMGFTSQWEISPRDILLSIFFAFSWEIWLALLGVILLSWIFKFISSAGQCRISYCWTLSLSFLTFFVFRFYKIGAYMTQIIHQHPVPAFRNLHDFADQLQEGQSQLAFVEGQLHYFEILAHSHPLFRRMLKSLEFNQPILFKNYSDLAENLAKNRRLATVTSEDAFKLRLRRYSCQLAFVNFNKEVPKTHLHFGFRKGSGLVDLFNAAFYNRYYSGNEFSDMWVRAYIKERTCSLDRKRTFDKKFETYTIQRFSSALATLAVVYAFCIATLLIERQIPRRSYVLIYKS